MKRLALAVSLLALLTTCAAYQAQHAGTDANTSRSEEAARQLAPDARVAAAFDAQPLALKQPR